MFLIFSLFLLYPLKNQPNFCRSHLPNGFGFNPNFLAQSHLHFAYFRLFNLYHNCSFFQFREIYSDVIVNISYKQFPARLWLRRLRISLFQFLKILYSASVERYVAWKVEFGDVSVLVEQFLKLGLWALTQKRRDGRKLFLSSDVDIKRF